MQKTIGELLKFGTKIAKKAGKILLKRYGQTHKVEFKSKNNLVTEADKKSENYIVKKINRRYPDHEILAEESGKKPISEISEEHIRWIIDPLDGTTNFAHGFPFFSVSIGIEKDGEMIGGIVYIPISKELFHAGKYMGAFLNGRKISVSDAENLDKSLLATGFPVEHREINL
ncbi:MAG: inositol monophosphatase family protein, partial [Patescibacteria group bacterium]